MSTTTRSRLLGASTATGALAITLALASPAQAVVPNDNLTPDDIVDTAGGVNGIGGMTVWNGDGTVGICTGSLINPRTVIFAAHCVNDRAPEDYGSQSGGVPISFGFNVDNLPAIIEWINSDFNTVAASNIFNVNEVQYSPDSLNDIYGLGFLEADVALATLDTPATGIPTWALLFSALPAPDSIDTVTGTGYHVKITGYGRSGNGTEGDIQGIDFRRRAAENYLGALASLDDTDAVIFGPAPEALPQNLYQLDFDDPDNANEFDFNLFRDDALPNEGTTAGGDSGGPLIIDEAFDEDVIIGVLSGGSRYFNEQVFSSYGTSSFYQPLFLFWDYIAEANPYRYVGAKRGNGAWEDPNHWVTLLDPNYRVIDEYGNLVNGIPTTLGEGPDGSAPDFGEVCLDGFGDVCVDLGSGVVRPVSGGGSAGIASSPGEIRFALEAQDGGKKGVPDGSGGGVPDGSNPSNGRPDPTLANGFPGATGFVPDNVDPDPANGVHARYFDVTLNRPGLTWLSSDIEIDRLTVGGAAALSIRESGSLNVLADYVQTGGITNVDGLLTTGEALMLGGALTGSGTVDPTYLTVVSGMIAPGDLRTGRLTIQGDLILASASLTAIDLTRYSNDRIDVVADADNAGIASLGGTLYLSRGFGPKPRWRQSYTVLTAQGGVDGTFDDVIGRFGILYPEVTYRDSSVRVRMEAGSLGDHVDRRDGIARAFAFALDSLRDRNYGSLHGFYGAIDLMDSAQLTATLSGLQPTVLNEAMSLSGNQNGMMLDLVSDRLPMLGTGQAPGGTLSVLGAPEMLGLATGQTSVTGTMAAQRSFAGRLTPGGRTVGALPDHMSGFVSGGYETGRATSRFSSGNDTQSSWHVAMGLEVQASERFTVGGASAFVNGRSTLSGGEADVRTSQAMAYASYRLGGGAYVAGIGSASVTDIEMQRRVNGGFETVRFGNDTRAMSYNLGVETGVNIGVTDGFALTPRAGVRYARTEIDGYREQGSEVALDVEDYTERRLEGRVGFNVRGSTEVGREWALQTNFNADYVRALDQGAGEMTVRFAHAAGVPIVLPGVGYDSSWTEMSGGVSLTRGRLSFGAAVEADIGRSDRRDQRAMAQASFRF